MIDKGQWGGIWPGHRGYTPTLYEKCHGIFNDHRESGPWFNVSSERRCLLTVQCPRHYTGVLVPTQTTGSAPPAGLTNTSSSSNLVFPGVSHPVLTSSTLLSFSGNRSWAAGWYRCVVLFLDFWSSAETSEKSRTNVILSDVKGIVHIKIVNFFF